MCETRDYDRTINSSSLLRHIIKIHLYPNSFQSMNVKRGFHVFGRRFIAAIEVARHEPRARSNKYKYAVKKHVAEFIKR